MMSRSHTYRRWLLLIFGFFAIVSLASEVQAQSQRAVDVDARIKTLFDLVNEYRTENGLVTFRASVKLTEVADWMARDMAANNYMAHTDSLGRDPFVRMDDLGYAFNTWKGENVAAGPVDPGVTLDLWKNSPGHNENLLRPEYTVMGLGRAYGANTTHEWYWAQEFGAYLEEEALYNPVNQKPTGAFDGADCTNAWGWARDLDVSPPGRLHAYRDGLAGEGGAFVEEFTANESRSDLGDDVGFNWAIPNSLKDGSGHTLYLYAIDSDGGINTLLAGSPKSITCSPSGIPSAQPDLLVQSITIAPSNPTPGASVTFTGFMGNEGPGAASFFFAGLRIDVDSNGTWDVLAEQLEIESLPARISGNIIGFEGTWVDYWTATAGTHTIEVCIDPGASVAEPDEANNCSTLTLVVPGSSTTPSPVDPVTIPDGALIRATGDPDVYIVKYVNDPSAGSGQVKKFKRLILSPSVFENYGHLRWEDVREVSPETRDAFVTSNLVRAVGDSRVFLLAPAGDTGTKYWAPSSAVFEAYGFDWDAIYEINAFDRDSYTDGPDLT